MVMFKVTNLMSDDRNFRDGFTGKNVIVGPDKSVVTSRPPKENCVWKVEKNRKVNKDKKLNVIVEEKQK